MITFTSQAAYVCQALHRTLFGVIESKPQYQIAVKHLPGTIGFGSKVSHDFLAMMIVSNILGVFRAIGPGFDTRSERDIIHLSEGKLRKSKCLPPVTGVRGVVLSSLDGLPSQGKLVRSHWIDFRMAGYADIVPCQERRKVKILTVLAHGSVCDMDIHIIVSDEIEFSVHSCRSMEWFP
jgi:hypothetical protein